MRRILAGVLVLASTLLVACGGGSGSSAPKAAQQAVSIALNPPPAASSIPVGSTTGITFTPVVTNDPGNSGVDWAVTCTNPSPQTAPCGTLSIPTMHSASGTAVTYLPPQIFPGGSLTVTVTVFATADHTKNVATAVVVSSYVNALKGTYVFEVNGSDSTFLPYESAGALVFDGNGNITSGIETLNIVSGFSTAYTVQGAGGAPSSYFIGPDGRGTITLNLEQTSNSSNVILETFSLVVISSSQALISELDSNSAAGTLELQDPTAASAPLTGAYSFVTSGTDSGSTTNPLAGIPAPTALGGVFNVDNNPSAGNISGHGSVADQDYYNATNAPQLLSCAPPTGVTGSVSSPGSLGTVTITLRGSTCFGTTLPSSIQFTGYIVDATHIRLIESDDINGAGGFLTAGVAISQGAAAGTFTAASLSGPYVFDALGIDVITGSNPTPSSFISAGVVNANGIGALSGITDTFFSGHFAAFSANPLTGTYAVDANHIGRVNVKLEFNGVTPPGPSPTILFYLTGNGAPPLVLYAGGEDANFPAIGVGFAYPQAANASTFSFGNPEKYAIRFTQPVGENNGTAQVTASASGNSGTLTGFADDVFGNLFGVVAPSVSLLDSFMLPADKFGRISGTFMNVTGSPGPFVEYYLVDNNHGFLIQTDLITSSQVALGYFAQACDVTSATSCPMAASGFPAKFSFRGSSSSGVRKAK